MVSLRTLIIECGINRVALGVFSRAGQRVRLHQFVEQTFASDETLSTGEPAAWINQTRDALRALAKRTKLRGPVTLVLPAHLTLTKAIKLPRVEAAQRDKILRFEAGQNIPYALVDVVWDSVVAGETATESEVLLATAKLEVLNPICVAATDAGFEPRLILPPALTTLAGFKLIQSTAAKNFLGLNLGVRSTTLVLFESGRFAVRTFSLGLESILADAPPDRSMKIEVIEPIRTKLLQEITRSLLHFQWRSGMGKPAHVWLAGAGAELPGLVEALTTKLKVPVEIADLCPTMDCAGDYPEALTAAQSLSLVDLAGAAAMQLQPEQATVNLLPPLTYRRLSDRKRRPWLVAAIVMTTLILLPPWLHFRSVRDEAFKKSTALERELAPLRSRDSRNRENLRQLDELKQRINVMTEIRARRTGWVRLLAGLQDRLTEVEDAWLEKLQVAPLTPGEPLKLLVSGRLLDRAHPLSKVNQETFTRVKILLSKLSAAPLVKSIEAERFDNQQPGILKFDFVLVTDANQPL